MCLEKYINLLKMNLKFRILQYLKNYLEKIDHFDFFIRKKASVPGFFFIQIGANDGIHSDPIYKYVKKYKWSGILIEPQKKYFLQLKENYKDMPQLKFENIAIGIKNEKMNLYKVAENEQEAHWHNAVSSLDCNRGVLAWMQYEKTIVTERVEVMTFANLIDKYDINKIDLLQIDVEGLEHKIIRSDHFFKIKPRIIHYEHRHLSYAEQEDCISVLQSNNYKIYLEKHDTTAVLR
jgi:FkbM family methyltransferase